MIMIEQVVFSSMFKKYMNTPYERNMSDMSWLRVMSMKPRPRQKCGKSRNTLHKMSLMRSSRC